MKIEALAPILLPFFALPLVRCWGTLGHQTVAYIATNLVASSTTTFFQALLGDTTESYLAGVATWADSYRYTKEGRFSAPLHFIDADNDPPESCGVVYQRDCAAEGCVVGAISNYTSQLLDPSTSSAIKLVAAKFIVHFVGDIHQPLHAEGLDRGGNSIPVFFNGVSSNLHAIWDTNMPDQLVGGYTLLDAQKWAANLTLAITTGIYKSESAGWLDGVDLSDPVSSAMVWAEDSNAFVCTNVLKDGVSAVQGQELNGTYFDDAIPVIEVQIAKAGLRLAKWLDLIMEGANAERTEL